MSRRALFVVMSLLIASCSGTAVDTTTTSSTTTTQPPTTTTQPTTTTTQPVAIDGAPEDLVGVVHWFYDFALGLTSDVPPAPVPIVEAVVPGQVLASPRTGVASVAVYQGQRIATVEMNGDLFLMVDPGPGWTIVGGNWPNVGLGPYYGPNPRLVAVVGSDARPGETVSAKLADSIHLVGLDGVGGGGIIGIPRDSWVSVPGSGNRKINGALATGGTDRLMATLGQLTGLPLEGYVLTGFVGFQEAIGNILGGVNMVIPFAINDRASGANFSAGEQYMNGPNALAFARARKTLPNGDFTRSAHQGLILIAAAKTVQSRGYGAIPTLLEMTEPWLETNLSAEQMLTFSALLISSNLDEIPNVVAPGRPGRAGSASVVFLTSSASQLWSDLADGNLTSG